MRIGCTSAIATVLMCVAGSALAAERLNDTQVIQLVQNVDKSFDRWKEDLDHRNMDDAVIRSAAGTIDVKKFLEDMEHDIDRVKDRIKPDYSAGPEVTAVLRRGSDVERRYLTQGATPEAWKTFSHELAALAAAYGLGWPIDANVNAQRKMDGELAADAKLLADSVDRLRDGALDAASHANRTKAERDEAERSMRELKQASEHLQSNLEKHRAVSTDASHVVELSGKAIAFARGVGPMSTNATTALTSIESATESIATAFRP